MRCCNFNQGKTVGLISQAQPYKIGPNNPNIHCRRKVYPQRTSSICVYHFSPFGQDIVVIISSVLGYTTSEYIYEIILALMSIYTPGQPLAIIYDYAKFIADRMHDQFLRMSNERVFKYYSVLYHIFLYYQAYKFPFTL